MSRRSTTLLALAFVTIPVLLTACGNSPAPHTTAPPTVRSTTTTTAIEITTPTVTVNGKSFPVPLDNANGPITPYSDTGQQVIYTSTGFLPRTLYSYLNKPVVWTNLSPHPLVLTLEHVGLTSVTIPTGGTYSWTPNVLDFGYKSSTGDAGVVNVGSFGF